MRVIIKIMALLTLVSITACSSQDNKSEQAAVKEPVKETDKGIFKAPMEALEQSKQVGQMLQEDEAQQRKKIEEAAQ